MHLEKEIEGLIDIAIEEDIRSGDITSTACIPKQAVTSARLFMKQAGVVAGLPFLTILFHKIDPEIEIFLVIEEGSFQKAGTVIGKISGPARGILSGERIALNLLQHASGVATQTRAYVKKIVGIDCAILDTRKTLPGLRALEKYAVRVGGGVNHRFSLDGRFVIKPNHCCFLAGNFAHPLQEAIKRAKEYRPDLPIEIEIDSIEYLQEALNTDACAIMLSRMPPQSVQRCVKEIRKTNKKVYLESLGTITLDTIRAYAETGIDGISVDAITQAEALDIGMRLTI